MNENLFKKIKDAGLIEPYARFKSFNSYKSDISGVYRTIGIYDTELEDMFYIYDNRMDVLLRYDPAKEAVMDDVSVVDENYLANCSLRYKVSNFSEEIFKESWLLKNPNATPMKLVPVGWLEQISVIPLVNKVKDLT